MRRAGRSCLPAGRLDDTPHPTPNVDDLGFLRLSSVVRSAIRSSLIGGDEDLPDGRFPPEREAEALGGAGEGAILVDETGHRDRNDDQSSPPVPNLF